ncbi:MAG: hypothetical protein WAT19_10545 [Ferruginibacter sp.]
MKTSTHTDIREMLETFPYRPSVSIIIPAEPQHSTEASLKNTLKMAIDKTERLLQEAYPPETCKPVLQKIRHIANGIAFDTPKKSIVIYASPVFEKLVYLDVVVEEKIIVDESFEIRDLLYSKKHLQNYLVLVLSEQQCRLYLSNADTFMRILLPVPENAGAFVNDVPERVANFSDPNGRQSVLLEKFLRNINKGLEEILAKYKLPLLITGTKKLLGHFRKLRRPGNNNVEYITGNYEEVSAEELRDVLQPHIEDLKKVKQAELLQYLDEAAGRKKLATGIRSVWQEAMHAKGKLLVVEKNYMYAAEHGSRADEIEPGNSQQHNQLLQIKDAVDDIIEKVLRSGGDVEFAESPMPAAYEHIALVEYY